LAGKSLPNEFSTFAINYNSLEEKWDLHKLIAMCVQEVERLKSQYVQHNTKKKTFGRKGYKENIQHESGRSNVQNKPRRNGTIQHVQSQPSQGKKTVIHDQCLWCKEKGYWQKDFPKFLKHMWTHGEDIITFVDESLYLSYSKSAWWIDSSATINVANFMQRFLSSRTLQKSARSIKVANGVKAEVEEIGELSIKLHNGFTLQLHDVLCVASLNINLILVSCFADDGFECHFGPKQCLIVYNKVCVGSCHPARPTLYVIYA
jgi:hypothetical protein